jgi:Zn-finger nucleic acid-binding protein
MNCPACGAPMKLKADMESYKCEYCQNVYLPEKNDDGVRVLAESADQNCPLCNLPLVHAILAKVSIIYCTGCRGMLIPMPALEPLIEYVRATGGAEAVSSAPDKEDLRRVIDCPQCHHRMDAHFYAGPGNVVIDSCEECSLIWLDHGAITRIAHAADVSTSPEASFSEDSDQQQGENSSGAGGMIVEGIIGSFFR